MLGILKFVHSKKKNCYARVIVRPKLQGCSFGLRWDLTIFLSEWAQFWQHWLSICGRVKSDDKRCSTCCLSNYLERAPCRASVHKCLEMGSMEAKKRMIMDKRFAWADAEARLRGFEYLAWQRAAALKAARCTWKGQVQPQAAKLSPSRSIVSGVPWFRCQQCPPDFNTATILLGHQMFGIYQL